MSNITIMCLELTAVPSAVSPDCQQYIHHNVHRLQWYNIILSPTDITIIRLDYNYSYKDCNTVVSS